MYHLPNNEAVDIENVVDGMLDDETSCRYFLDLKTGDVIQVEPDGTDPSDTTRYAAIPKLHNTLRDKTIKEFIRDLVYSEDRKLAQRLKRVHETQGRHAVYAHLENVDEAWLYALDEWEGDVALDRFEEWTETLPVSITNVFEGCGECAICRAMEAGADEEALLDAFMEQNLQNAQWHGPDRSKTPVNVEADITALIQQYNLTDTLSVETVKRWIYESDPDPMKANKQYMERWNALFENVPYTKDVYEKIMTVFTDAWNVFPHKALGGKSPNEMYEEEKGA